MSDVFKDGLLDREFLIELHAAASELAVEEKDVLCLLALQNLAAAAAVLCESLHNKQASAAALELAKTLPGLLAHCGPEAAAVGEFINAGMRLAKESEMVSLPEPPDFSSVEREPPAAFPDWVSEVLGAK